MTTTLLRFYFEKRGDMHDLLWNSCAQASDATVRRGGLSRAMVRVAPMLLGCVAALAQAQSAESGFENKTFHAMFDFDPSQWKITLPDGTERNTHWLMEGNTSPDEFYYDDDGWMVFRCPNVAGSTPNSTYARSELRGLLHGAVPGISHRGFTLNNWVLATSSESVKSLMGGIDGTMQATLKVDRVSDTGDAARVGRVIIGQIHAADDEPLRLYYRKLPQNQRGSLYFAHQTPGGTDTWYELIGSRSNTASDPDDGIALGEIFSYRIVAAGLQLTVMVSRLGKPDIVRTLTMDSGYNDDWMYFKAGVYNQNNTGSASDYVQATFFGLHTTHDAPPAGE